MAEDTRAIPGVDDDDTVVDVEDRRIHPPTGIAMAVAVPAIAATTSTQKRQKRRRQNSTSAETTGATAIIATTMAAAAADAITKEEGGEGRDGSELWVGLWDAHDDEATAF